MPFAFLSQPRPDFSSRGVAKPPARFVPNPPAPAPAPRVSVASHPPPHVFTPVQAPVQPPAPASDPVPRDPQPIGFSTGFSPHIETFKSIGDSYFLTDLQVQADVSRWAIYPAVQTVILDGNAIEAASDIGTTTLSATEAIGSPVLNLLRGPGGVPGKINMRDNNGVNHVLESVNSNLYFDDELLARAGDIQDIADWALYAAIANVDMDNNSIVNCGSITNIAGATIDNSQGTIKALNLDMGPDDASRIRFTNTFGASKDLKLEVGGGEHLQWGGENVVTGDVVTSLNTQAGALTLTSANANIVVGSTGAGNIELTAPTPVTSLDGITGDIVLQAGPGILIGPGIGPQNISISAPTIGEATDPPGPGTAYGQANQAILDAEEALAAAEAAQATADEALAAAEAAQATADAAAAEAAAASAAAAAAAAAAATAEATAAGAAATAAGAAAGVAAIEAAYVTKVGLAGNQRSGEITLAAGANTTITEAPNGTFTIASTGGAAGVTSLNSQAGALTLTSANANIVVGSTGAGNIQLTAPTPVTSLNALTGPLTLVGGSGISVTPAGSNITIATTGAGSVFQATYYKSANQNLQPPPGGSTDITFDLTAAWNNDGGYITHVNTTTVFTVVQAGLYQLEWNASVSPSGATWNPGTVKIASIDITRIGFAEQIAIGQTFATSDALNTYIQNVCSSFYLNVGDIINLRLQTSNSTATPVCLGVGTGPDLNTWFTWRYISAAGNASTTTRAASFSSTQTQGVAAVNTVTPITYNTTDLNTGGFTQSGASIRVPSTGTYEIIPSLQLNKTGGGQADIYFWLQASPDNVAWTDVTNTSTEITIASSGNSLVGTVPLMLALNANEYIRIVFASGDAGSRVLAVAAQAAPFVRPANPSIITTIKLLI
jgi:hypothetical protein